MMSPCPVYRPCWAECVTVYHTVIFIMALAVLVKVWRWPGPRNPA